MITVHRAVIIATVLVAGFGWRAGLYHNQPQDRLADAMDGGLGAAQARAPLPTGEEGDGSADAAALTRAHLGPRLQALESRLQQLGRQVRAQDRRWRQQREEIERLAHALEAGAGAINPDLPAEDNAPAQSDEERAQARVAQLEAELATQNTDPHWSQEAVARITGAVDRVLKNAGAEQDPGAALVDAACRASICRIELAYRGEVTMEGFANDVVLGLGWQSNFQFDTVQNPDGSMTTVVYLAKDGHRLPEPAS